MWLFTRSGFYSVTRSKTEGIQVRARSIEHLDNLMLRMISASIQKSGKPGPWRRAKSMETPDNDYRFRVIIDSDMLDEMMEEFASDPPQYTNFKGECLKQVRSGKLDEAYESALHDVWQVMYDYQQGKS